MSTSCCKIQKLSDEVLIRVLTYLRSVDLASVREVDKTIFSSYRVSTCIHLQLSDYSLFIATVGATTQQFKVPDVYISDLLRPDILYIREISAVNIALNSSPPPAGKGLLRIIYNRFKNIYYIILTIMLASGYWISTCWLSNAKKYFDSLVLPDLERQVAKTPKKRQSKIRHRRGSDALPPWPDINTDLLCAHNNLSLSSGRGLVGLKGRRKAIDGRSWYILRKFYPHGPAFKCSTSSECPVCYAEKKEAQASAVGKKEAELQVRRNDFIPADLEALSARKCGVPVASITSRFDMYTTDRMTIPLLEQQQSQKSSAFTDQPSQPRSSSWSFDSLPDLEEFAYTSSGGVPSSSWSPFTTMNNSGGDNTNDIERSGLYQQPLVPGLYNIIPREWLRMWRRYTRDADVPPFPPLDCAGLFCSSHGLELFTATFYYV